MHCYDCKHLDKTQKQSYTIKGDVLGDRTYTLYGCKRLGNVVGWANSDTDLKNMGCSIAGDEVDEQAANK